MSAYNNMVNDIGEATAAFIAMPETRQIAQPKNLLQQIYIGNGRIKSKNRFITK